MSAIASATPPAPAPAGSSLLGLPHRGVRLQLAAGSYGVYIGDGLLREAGRLIANLGLPRQCAVITDTVVAPLHEPALTQALREAGLETQTFTFSAGEHSKSMVEASRLCEEMFVRGLGRSSTVVALGGGVCGDLAGFVAAIFCRGVAFVQVPTTIMAQVDSSVGGKTGVNARAGKNLIGAFHQPWAVIADTATLRTLPRREFNEGLAEAVKHACIRDPQMLDNLEGRPDHADLPAIIERNVQIKAAVVMADEREISGERAHLNFGHTIGHGIEKAAGYGRYLHGEAISLGLVAALRLSRKKLGLPLEDVAQVTAILETLELPIKLDPNITVDAIMSALRKDKKFVDGKIRFVLVPRLGEAILSSAVTETDIEAEIRNLY